MSVEKPMCYNRARLFSMWQRVLRCMRIRVPQRVRMRMLVLTPVHRRRVQELQRRPCGLHLLVTAHAQTSVQLKAWSCCPGPAWFRLLYSEHATAPRSRAAAIRQWSKLGHAWSSNTRSTGLWQWTQ